MLPAMHELRWAIMGTGRIAAGVLPRVADAPGCRVVAVASRDRAKALALARDCGRIAGDPAHAACTYEELLGRDDVDAVYVTLVNNLHHEWCLRLLESGKHVLCEKPLVATAREAETLRAAAARAERLIVEGFMWMHHPQTARLVELASAGEAGPIGRLVRIVSRRNVRTTDEYILATRLSHALQGGALMDIGCYPVSAAMLLAGQEPDWSTLRAAAVLADPVAGETRAVDDTMTFSWTFPSGVEFAGEASFSKGDGVLLELVGTRGSARTTFPFSPDPERQVLVVNKQEEVFVNGGERFTNQFARFARAVRGEAAPLPSIDLSVRIADAIERIHRAAGIRWGG
jgi:predicted dehydrogenase